MGNVGQRGILERIQKRVVRGTSLARGERDFFFKKTRSVFLRGLLVRTIREICEY